MTPDQVKLVQQSFAKVAPISEQAAVIFYDRLFEVAPAVKAMFPADMTEQRKKLMATLAVVVNSLSNLESVLPAASALALLRLTTDSRLGLKRFSGSLRTVVGRTGQRLRSKPPIDSYCRMR